jgi:hypothetical protein
VELTQKWLGINFFGLMPNPFGFKAWTSFKEECFQTFKLLGSSLTQLVQREYE